jgi:hypothetical protein
MEEQETQILKETRRLGKYEVKRILEAKDLVTYVFPAKDGLDIIKSMNIFAATDYPPRLTILLNQLRDKTPKTLGAYSSKNSAIIVRAEEDSAILTIHQQDISKRNKDVQFLEEILR